MADQRTHSNLYLYTLDEDWHKKTCNYWYLVQTATGPHAAFEHRASLLAWMERLGLSITTSLPFHRMPSAHCIAGSYRTHMHLYDADDFWQLAGEHTRTLSNGRYTLGIITHDPDGMRTLHTLNPNVTLRTEYNYQESRTLVG